MRLWLGAAPSRIGRLRSASALALLLSVAEGMPADPIAILRPVRFRDELRNLAPVAGTVLRGVTAGASTSEFAETTTLMVDVPPQGADSIQLCLEMASRDGAYSGTGIYHLASTTGGPYRLDIPTQHAAALRKYHTNEIALLASLAENCERSRSLQVLPIGWGSLPRGSPPIVFVNSQGA